LLTNYDLLVLDYRLDATVDQVLNVIVELKAFWKFSIGELIWNEDFLSFLDV
jgi:hypothetical protein